MWLGLSGHWIKIMRKYGINILNSDIHTFLHANDLSDKKVALFICSSILLAENNGFLYSWKKHTS